MVSWRCLSRCWLSWRIPWPPRAGQAQRRTEQSVVESRATQPPRPAHPPSKSTHALRRLPRSGLGFRRWCQPGHQGRIGLRRAALNHKCGGSALTRVASLREYCRRAGLVLCGAAAPPRSAGYGRYPPFPKPRRSSSNPLFPVFSARSESIPVRVDPTEASRARGSRARSTARRAHRPESSRISWGDWRHPRAGRHPSSSRCRVAVGSR
jgi:hypothetical protein